MQNNNDTIMQEEQMLSTLDNPFNPFNSFDAWNQYDHAMGYYTLSYLGRIVDYSNCVNEEQRRKAREFAINEIIQRDPLGIYCKVSRNEIVKPIKILNQT